MNCISIRNKSEQKLCVTLEYSTNTLTPWIKYRGVSKCNQRRLTYIQLEVILNKVNHSKIKVSLIMVIWPKLNMNEFEIQYFYRVVVVEMLPWDHFNPDRKVSNSNDICTKCFYSHLC